MSEEPVFDAARVERMARRMKRVNVPMRFVLGLPFPTPLGSRLMLVYFTGRKTGRPYRQPVSYVRDGDVLLTPGGGKWKLNLRPGEPVMIRLRGRDVTAWPDLVRGSDEVDRLLRQMMVQNPRLTSFVPFIGSDGVIDRAKCRRPLSMASALSGGASPHRGQISARRTECRAKGSLVRANSGAHRPQIRCPSAAEPAARRRTELVYVRNA